MQFTSSKNKKKDAPVAKATEAYLAQRARIWLHFFESGLLHYTNTHSTICASSGVGTWSRFNILRIAASGTTA